MKIICYNRIHMTHEIHRNPERDQPQEKRELVGSLIKDFRNSYKYSQGNPNLQHLLFTLVRDHYVENNGDTLEQLPPALLTVSDHIGRFTLPPQHKGVNFSITDDFRKMFTEFDHCLTQPGYVSQSDDACYFDREALAVRSFPEQREERIEVMLDMIARQDALYLAEGGRYALEGRPRDESSGSDRYESYLRTYVLGGADTYSTAYNEIFSHARSGLVASYPQTGFEWHKSMWENRHPNEDYYPPAFVEELQGATQGNKG